MMRFLVIGLGSMGKRRVRCLQALGYKNIAGFDLREDRRDEAVKKYGITVYADIVPAMNQFAPDAFIISVPPEVHPTYMFLSTLNKIHFFVEVNILDTNYEEIMKGINESGIVAAPSATMLFHPAIQQINEIIKSADLGKISNFIFHSGQYLPDWHTYENVSDYYVSKPATGGAREIVSFELTWITNILGFPKRICGNVRKTIHIDGAEKIDDTYNSLLDYEKFLTTITVDVVSRCPTRRLLINGDQKQLIWDWNQKNIQIYDPSIAKWKTIEYRMMDAEAGYNPNLGENMYINELRAFIKAIEDNEPFINTMEKDHNVLKLLYAIEQSDQSGGYVEFEKRCHS